MIRSQFKHKPCSICQSPFHSKGYHNPHKITLKAKKPMRHESPKAKQKRLATTAAWDAANPPDANGYWYCYISKHPLCPKRLTIETLVREHDKSKTRRKDLQHDITNIYPACTWDNEAKGSLSAEEYMAL